MVVNGKNCSTLWNEKHEVKSCCLVLLVLHVWSGCIIMIVPVCGTGDGAEGFAHSG